MRASFCSLLVCVSVLSGPIARAADYDLVVYGGTAAAVIAAVQAKKMGKTVVVVSPDKHLGGLSSGGLGFTDTGNKAVIGGLARDFYHRIWQHYDSAEAWRWQKKSEYGGKGQGTSAVDGENRTMWIFEPSAAEKVFEAYVKEFAIPVQRDEWLDRAKGVKKAGGRITSITTLSGKTYTGKMFIDATYEGDLMAAAGVDFVFYAADTAAQLAKLKSLKSRLQAAGAIWVVSLKGKAATIKDTDVMKAARAAGLVDNKVCSFSATHTALKLVIPRDHRP